VKEVPLTLTDQYTAALKAYLTEGGEAQLEHAYELGRCAMAEGMGVLELAAIYHRSLTVVLAQTPLSQESQATLDAAANFYTESLSPFEMAQRGFQEAYSSLHKLNGELAKRAIELKRANGMLAREIREHERAEELIRGLNVELEHRAVALEAVNRELEAFNYSVSHDLRAPLRGIEGFSRVLEESYAEVLDDRGKDCLRRVRAASQRMSQLIEDLLDLSLMTRAEMRRAKVDLSALARSIAAELQQAEPERRVVFQIQDGLKAEGDARLLHVVLENLLGNAWKFTGKRLSAEIALGATHHDGGTAFYVRDNGEGFDAAYADKLFAVFQRLHSTSEFPGTGVGLATVQRIIHRHGGRVWAEGAVDQGATFYFTL